MRNTFISRSATKYTQQICKIFDDTPSSLNVIHIVDWNYIIPVRGKKMIVISGETWHVPSYVDLLISSKLQKNSAQQPKHIIYYPQMYMSYFERRTYFDKIDFSIHFNQRKFCCYMYSHDLDHRVKMFKLICKLKNVDALGKSQKNVKIKNTRREYGTETYNDIAVRLYSSYKFVIAMENKLDEGYFTEKIINPILANSIPIYWGHDYVFKFINKKRVIYIPDYNESELLKKLKKIDKNEIYFQKILNEPTFTDEKYTMENFNNSVLLEIENWKKYNLKKNKKKNL